MALRSDSRYGESEFLWVTTQGRGAKLTTYLDTITLLTAAYRVHIVREDDTIQMLASLYYGDATKWNVLADANPHLFNPHELTPGDMMRIPQ